MTSPNEKTHDKTQVERASDRELVLRRTFRTDPATLLNRRSNFDLRFDDLVVNRTPQKPWVQNIAFGGGSCWTGNTPRMHPNDFRTKSLYGVGVDWPLDYDALEPYFLRVERAMGIAGGEAGPYPRSAPYPFPAHRLNAFDEARYPDAIDEFRRAEPALRDASAGELTRYALYRGLTHLSLGDARAAEYWLGFAKRKTERDPTLLSAEDRSRLACAWRSQCAETSAESPARSAAAFTTRCTALSSSGPPPLRERNTGASGSGLLPIAPKVAHVLADRSTTRVLPPLP